MIKKIVNYFIRKPSLGRIKIVLFPVLVTALTFDYVVDFNWKNNEISIGTGSSGLTLAFLLAFIFACLIAVDIWDRHRELKIQEKKLDILADKNVSNRVKEEIARNLNI